MAQATCEDRIGKEWEQQYRSMAKQVKRLNSRFDRVRELAYEQVNESLLSVDKQTVYKLMFSWGGPSDWLEVFVDDDRDIARIVYHFSDWFDHAEKELRGVEFDTAAEWAGQFIE